MHAVEPLFCEPPKRYEPPHRDVGLFHLFSAITPVECLQHVTFFAGRSVVSVTQNSIGLLCKSIWWTLQKCSHVVSGILTDAMKSKSVVQSAASAIGFFLRDNEFDAASDALEVEIRTKTGSYIYQDAAALFTNQTMAYLETFVVGALSVETRARPKWVQEKLIDENGLSFRGLLLKKLVEENRELFEKALYKNLLVLFSNGIDRAKQLQQGKDSVLCDLVLSLLKGTSKHFFNIREKEIKCEEFSSGQLQAVREGFTKSLTNALIPLLFPHGAKDIDLPTFPVLGSYIVPYLLSMSQRSLVPELFSDLFTELFSHVTKTKLFETVFIKEHTFVELPHPKTDPKEVPSVKYEKTEQFVEAFSEVLQSFLAYLDEDSVAWFLSWVTPRKLSIELIYFLETHTIEELLEIILESTLPSMNKGGSFVKDDGKKRFLQTPVTFVTKNDRFDYKEKRKVEKLQAKKEHIEQLIETIGSDPKGLSQLIQMGVFKVAHVDDDEGQNFFTRTFRGVHRQVSSGAIGVGLYFSDLHARLKAINQALYTKISKKEHELLVYELIKIVVKSAIVDVKSDNFTDFFPTSH